MKLETQWILGSIRLVEENNMLMERQRGQDNFIIL
jgi:hypothetical protein